MTLQLPRVPAPKTGFHFDGVAEHQTRQALVAEIRETIEALIKSTYVPGWQVMFYKFIDCLAPGTVRDDARLPYPTAGPNDRAGTKIGCVYARLSWVIQLYWAQCFEGADNTERIRYCLDDLQQWAARGVDKCRIEGDVRQGYWLGVLE